MRLVAKAARDETRRCRVRLCIATGRLPYGVRTHLVALYCAGWNHDEWEQGTSPQISAPAGCAGTSSSAGSCAPPAFGAPGVPPKRPACHAAACRSPHRARKQTPNRRKQTPPPPKGEQARTASVLSLSWAPRGRPRHISSLHLSRVCAPRPAAPRALLLRGDPAPEAALPFALQRYLAFDSRTALIPSLKAPLAPRDTVCASL